MEVGFCMGFRWLHFMQREIPSEGKSGTTLEVGYTWGIISNYEREADRTSDLNLHVRPFTRNVCCRSKYRAILCNYLQKIHIFEIY